MTRSASREILTALRARRAATRTAAPTRTAVPTRPAADQMTAASRATGPGDAPGPVEGPAPPASPSRDLGRGIQANGLLAGLLGALFFVAAWSTRGWPLIGDAPLYHYVVWLIGEGLAPYRDVFDFNMPGVYLLHRAVVATLGAGDLGWRLFDLGWLLATLALLYAFCRPLAGRAPAAAAALLFGLYHLADGPWMAGQRDYLVGLFLLGGAHAVALYAEQGGERGAPRALIAAGLGLGAGMLLKPYVGLFWLGCVAAAAAAGRRSGQPAWRGAALLVAPALVPPLLTAAWLVARGGLGAYLETFFGYLLPFYGKLGAGPLAIWRDPGLRVFGWQILTLLLALALLGLTAPIPGRLVLRRWLAVWGVLYGVLHYTLQRKGFGYHISPLMVFLAALAAPALGSGEGRLGRSGWRDDLRRLAGLLRPFAGGGSSGTSDAVLTRPLVARALALLTAVLLAGASYLGLARRDLAPFEARIAAIESDLERLVAPGEPVQVMDDTWANALHVLLRQHRHQPAAFLYDFPLFHDPADPRIAALRQRWIEAVVTAPPAAFVVSEITANRTGYERLGELPELAALLSEQYQLAVDGDGYRIYLRRGGTAAGDRETSASGGDLAQPGGELR